MRPPEDLMQRYREPTFAPTRTELAHADVPESPTPLLDEHMNAVSALEVMKRSQLGKRL